MKISFSAFLNVILIVVLAASLLFVICQSAVSPRKYDPLVDVNDDGRIDILDLAKVATLYGTQGVPMNKTYFTHPGAVDRPAYDSGWVSINVDQEIILTHNVGTTDVLVYMVGKSSDTASPYIHQKWYGGEVNVIAEYGVFWYDLTKTTVRVQRHLSDANWNWVRIMIWKIMNS